MIFKEGEIKMKKLLVLLMVLGLATSAQAALSLQINGSDVPTEMTVSVSTNIVIQVYSSTATPWYGWIEGADVGYTSNDTSYQFTKGEFVEGTVTYPTNQKYVTVYSIAGDLGRAIAETDYKAWKLMSDGLTVVPSAGTQYDVTFHCKATGDAVINLFGTNYVDVIDSIIIHQTPEPITMALLGLGGLFLRRRK
jgi:hypothetical protein